MEEEGTGNWLYEVVVVASTAKRRPFFLFVRHKEARGDLRMTLRLLAEPSQQLGLFSV
jgi:hypothetical protein